MSSLKELILSDHSRVIRDAVVAWVGRDQDRMRELMEFFLSEEKLIAQRASWPVGKIARDRPFLMIPYLNEMFYNLEKPVHDAVKRNTIRCFQDITIPENLEGPLYELCFEYLNDTKQAIAVRVFSMNVLSKVANKFPELIEELIEMIKIHYDDGSAGFKSAARKNLKKLTKKN